MVGFLAGVRVLIIIHIVSHVVSVGIVISPLSKQLRNRGWIPGRGKSININTRCEPRCLSNFSGNQSNGST